ncbi:coenzyme F420-0:L-glutamate ligase [Methyloligella sp. 2.7D]|uniref:coenzyme F420-0:L-glutamate ligase n=1 Tax=unclassified Methyloligella TaxID=2625955 RepID=UPI00157D59D1|nr:coenzyme F420-0:L-glutamate ligase [Methyloligella sp. GL2]QKP76950.1 coenzyme F420-0:L-glutamate ligase [Methyloligella sp. GL2]
MTKQPTSRLEIAALDGIGRIEAGDDLTAILMAALHGMEIAPRAGDILVLAQKIVSKAEGRTVKLSDVEPSERARHLAAETEKDPRVVELILRESREVVRLRPGLIVVEDRRGLVLANAGIDASNVGAPDAEESVLLLPEEPDASAARLAASLTAACGHAVAVIINDSIGRAWRNGTVGTAIGASGLVAHADLCGQPDMFGRTLQATTVGIADELAAAASLVMGQAAEGRPAALIRGFSAPAGEGKAEDLLRPREMDLFR